MHLVGVAVAPDLPDQLRSRDHGARLPGQSHQDPELGRRQGHRTPVAADLVPTAINGQTGKVQTLDAPRLAGQLSAAQPGVDASHQLPNLEGLAQVVVGTHLETDHHVLGFVQAADHQHGNFDPGRAKPATDLNSTHVRKHQVE